MKQLLPFIFLLTFCASFAQHSGGPDAYGYTWKSSLDPANGLTSQWIDLETKAGAIDVTDKFGDLDKTYGPINFSFEFPYYWYKRTSMFINSGGALSFVGGPFAEPYPDIPQVGGFTDDYLAPMLTNLTFMDIDGTRFPDAKLLFYTDFKDTVIVSWHNVKFFNGLDVPVSSPPNLTSLTFQVIFTKDGSIIYQYIKLEGEQLSCQSGGNCISVGIENVNGTSGLQVKKGSGTDGGPVETYFSSATPANPIMIKFFPPATSSFNKKDIAINWTDNEINGGKFVLKGSTVNTIDLKVTNNGLSTTPSLNLTTKVFEGASNTASSTKNLTIPSLASSASAIVPAPAVIPTSSEKIYRVENNITYSADDAVQNNKLNYLVSVVDSSQSEINLQYTDDNPESYWRWNGADQNTLGYANYFEPPFYPVKLTHMRVWLSSYDGFSPPANVVLRIYANDGLNLFGYKDGSAGTMLLEQEVLTINLVNGENVIALDEELQVNSGGIYAGLFFTSNTQGADTYLGMDESQPFSYRSFFARFGVFQESTDRQSMDPAIAVNVKKGDLNQVIELGLMEIVNPTDSQIITDSVTVIVKLKNNGPQPITGPFDLIYQADARPEVIETVGNNVTINPGVEYAYTFKQKAARPPAPRTQYNSFCSRLFLANDFDLTNNKICYSTLAGIDTESDLPHVDIYPNPASGHVTLTYGLKKESSVRFRVVDLTGRVLLDEPLGKQQAGMHRYEHTFDLPSGIYIYKVISDKNSYAGKLYITN